MTVASLSGLTVVGVETELLALARSVCPPNQTTILVDFGSASTGVGIVREGRLALSYSISNGGDALTRAIASTLNMNFAQAEEYKRAYGRSEEHTSELQSQFHLVCRLPLA